MELQVTSATGSPSIGPLLGGLDFGESQPVPGQPSFSNLLEEALGKLPLSSQGLALGHVRQVFSELLSQMDRKELVAYLASLPEAERTRLSKMPEAEWQQLLKQAGLPVDERVPLKGLFEEVKEQAASQEDAPVPEEAVTENVVADPSVVPMVADVPVPVEAAAPDLPTPPAPALDADGPAPTFFQSEPDPDLSLAPETPLAPPATTTGTLVTASLPQSPPAAVPVAQVVTVPEWTAVEPSPLPTQSQPPANEGPPVVGISPPPVDLAPVDPMVPVEVQAVQTDLGESPVPPALVAETPDQPVVDAQPPVVPPVQTSQIQVAPEPVRTPVAGDAPLVAAPELQPPVVLEEPHTAPPQPGPQVKVAVQAANADRQSQSPAAAPPQAAAPQRGPQVKAAVQAAKAEVKGETPTVRTPVPQTPDHPSALAQPIVPKPGQPVVLDQPVTQAPQQPIALQPKADAPKLGPQVKAAVQAVKAEIPGEAPALSQPVADTPDHPVVPAQPTALPTQPPVVLDQPVVKRPQPPAAPQPRADAPYLGPEVKAAAQAVKREVKGETPVPEPRAAQTPAAHHPQLAQAPQQPVVLARPVEEVPDQAVAQAPQRPAVTQPKADAPKRGPQVKAAVQAVKTDVKGDHPAPIQHPQVARPQVAHTALPESEQGDDAPETTADWQVPDAPRDLTGFIPVAPPLQPVVVARDDTPVEAVAPAAAAHSQPQADLSGDGLPQPLAPQLTTAQPARDALDVPEAPEAPQAAFSVELEPEVVETPALPPTQTVLQTINQGTPVHFSQVPVMVQEVIELVPLQVGNTTQIEVRLDPPQVGPIKVTFTLNAPQQMGVVIETMTQTAQRVMEAYVPRMQQTVQNNGLAMRVEPEVRLNPDAVSDAGQAKGRGDRQMGQRQRRRSGREDLTV